MTRAEVADSRVSPAGRSRYIDEKDVFMARQTVMHGLTYALAGFGLLAPAMPHAAQPPKAAPPVARKQTTIGDMRITNFDTSRGKTDGSSVTITGKQTVVEVPDKKNKTLARLHADTIVGGLSNGKNVRDLELKENVTFRFVKQQEDSRQILEGTAHHGIYRRSAGVIELDGNVRATVTDDGRLSGPGRIQAERIVVDMNKTPYGYTIEGGSSSLQFTPKGSTTKKNSAHLGNVVIDGFASGAFQSGQTARFIGPETTLTITNPDDKTRTRIQADTVETTFTADKKTLSKAQATGNVRYSTERPSPNGKSTQTLTGTSARLEYSAEDATVLLDGRVNARITDTESLLKPAHITGDRVFAQLTTADKPARYEISGAASRNLVRFTPKPAPEFAQKPDAAPARRFPLGDVQIARFDSGEYEPGKTLEFKGEHMMLTTNDAPSRSSSSFEAGRLHGGFAADGSIAEIVASSASPAGVRFSLKQPAPATGKPADAKLPQEAVSGTAARASFVNSTEVREVRLEGRLSVDVLSPDNLEGPGHLAGEEGDVVRLLLNTAPYEFEIDSPKQTATINFVPKDKTETASDTKTK